MTTWSKSGLEKSHEAKRRHGRNVGGDTVVRWLTGACRAACGFDRCIGGREVRCARLEMRAPGIPQQDRPHARERCGCKAASRTVSGIPRLLRLAFRRAWALA